MRLDIYLASAGLAKSRSRAAQLISGGFVSVNGKIITKSSCDVSDSDKVLLLGEEHRFVGRGGMKLDAAIERFHLQEKIRGLICADIGASTGGFTDCLLSYGAARVYAIDSGHDQLDLSLKNDGRVVNIEGFNARYLTPETLAEKCGCAVSDLSFISQTLVIPAICSILDAGALFVTLIKPQFECGREALGHSGVVRDKKQHISAVRRVAECASENGLAPCGIMKSPITGGDGNTEFLMYTVFGGTPTISDENVTEAVYE